MPEILRPVPRPSSGETLLDLYKGVQTRQIAPVDAYTPGIRSHLTPARGLTINRQAWGLSKQAGSPNYMSTNRYADTQYERTFMPAEFQVFSRKPGSFNNYALQYARNAYDHDNRSYWG